MWLDVSAIHMECKSSKLRRSRIYLFFLPSKLTLASSAPCSWILAWTNQVLRTGLGSKDLETKFLSGELVLFTASYLNWYISIIRSWIIRTGQWIPRSDHLTVDSSDQQTPSINLQTARETPVIHPPSPASSRFSLATRTTTYLLDVVHQALIGWTSIHQKTAMMRFAFWMSLPPPSGLTSTLL